MCYFQPQDCVKLLYNRKLIRKSSGLVRVLQVFNHQNQDGNSGYQESFEENRTKGIYRKLQVENKSKHDIQALRGYLTHLIAPDKPIFLSFSNVI